MAAFGRAVSDALAAKGLEQRDLAGLLTEHLDVEVRPASISQWLGGVHEPSRARVFAIEQVLKARPGALSQHLGYLPVTARAVRSVLEAIDSDAALTDRSKAMLRAAYQQAVLP